MDVMTDDDVYNLQRFTGGKPGKRKRDNGGVGEGNEGNGILKEGVCGV
jgi:hypothetical protein